MYKPMRFWGTSGGAGVPSPFCRCFVCENARKVGGKEIRHRSAFRIDKKVMIDTGADFVTQAARFQDDLFDIEHILITHTHGDHFNERIMWSRVVGAKMPETTMTIYFVDDAHKIVDRLPIEGNVRFEKLEFGKTYNISGMEVTPLRGVHNTAIEKNSANYLIKLADGRIMYYGVDSGYYLDETFEFLKNYKLDIFITECTYPRERPIEESVPSHMDLSRCVENLDTLYENGTIDESTKIFATHIDCKGKNHAQLEEYFANLDRGYKVIVAYDGMSIDED